MCSLFSRSFLYRKFLHLSFAEILKYYKSILRFVLTHLLKHECDIQTWFKFFLVLFRLVSPMHSRLLPFSRETKRSWRAYDDEAARFFLFPRKKQKKHAVKYSLLIVGWGRRFLKGDKKGLVFLGSAAVRKVKGQMGLRAHSFKGALLLLFLFPLLAQNMRKEGRKMAHQREGSKKGKCISTAWMARDSPNSSH